MSSGVAPVPGSTPNNQSKPTRQSGRAATARNDHAPPQAYPRGAMARNRNGMKYLAALIVARRRSCPFQLGAQLGTKRAIAMLAWILASALREAGSGIPA